MQIHSGQLCSGLQCAVVACAAQRLHYCTVAAAVAAVGGTARSAVPDAAVLLLATALHGQQTLHSLAPAHCSAGQVLGWAASCVRWKRAHTYAAFARLHHTSAKGIRMLHSALQGSQRLMKRTQTRAIPDCAMFETCSAVEQLRPLLPPLQSTGHWTSVKNRCPAECKMVVRHCF